jgi:hypothetical protein
LDTSSIDTISQQESNGRRRDARLVATRAIQSPARPILFDESGAMQTPVPKSKTQEK